jgi:predicted enzyme related to lactoylglutathione lyase
MPKRDVAPNGAPCWVDLMTKDQARSGEFYSELFGWTIDDPGPDYGGYKNFQTDGVPVAGFMGKSEGDGSPPEDSWTVYLATADARKTVEAAAANGGQIFLAPQEVMQLGTMAMVADPGGAAIGIWQPGDHKGFGFYAEPNAPGWFELHTREYDKAVAFYRTVFGWDTHTMSDSPEFRYTTLGQDDDALAGIMDGTTSLPEGAPSAWSVYFQVESTDDALTKIEKLGGTIEMPAENTPYGRLAVANDATGANFRLVGENT